MRNMQYSLRSRKIDPSTTRHRSLGPAVFLFSLLALALAATAQETPSSVPGRNSLPPRNGTLVYRDPRLPSLPTRRWEQSLPGAALQNNERYGRLRDPRRNAPYQYRLQVRCLAEGEEEIGERRFVVHYNEAADEALARRVGAVLARLHWLARDYLGRMPLSSDRGSGYVDVWLQREGPAGGEEYNGHLYLTGIGESRPAAEWVRELAHEYAHLTIPVAGPYTEPEQWANGYLGERLFLKWLLVDNGATDLWDQPINGQGYLTHQVIPFRTRFLEAGPDAPDAERMDGRGMEFFIGTVLALEAAHGPSLLRALFNHFDTPRPQNLGGNLTLALHELQARPFPLNPRAFIPSSIRPSGAGGGTGEVTVEQVAYWVYLTGGQWRLEVEGELHADLVARVEKRALRPAADKAPDGRRTWVLPVVTRNGLWRRLEFTSPSGSAFTLRSVRFDYIGR